VTANEYDIYCTLQFLYNQGNLITKKRFSEQTGGKNYEKHFLTNSHIIAERSLKNI
jgi:hypothetical protein